MSHADGPNARGPAMLDGDDDAEIELEPTIYQGAYSPASASQSFHMAVATSSMPSLTTETGDLLRIRLKAAALFLAVGYAVFFIFGLLDEGSVQGMALLYIGARVALCLAVVGLLSSQFP